MSLDVCRFLGRRDDNAIPALGRPVARSGFWGEPAAPSTRPIATRERPLDKPPVAACRAAYGARWQAELAPRSRWQGIREPRGRLTTVRRSVPSSLLSARPAITGRCCRPPTIHAAESRRVEPRRGSPRREPGPKQNCVARPTFSRMSAPGRSRHPNAGEGGGFSTSAVAKNIFGTARRGDFVVLTFSSLSNWDWHLNR
jgi:hypothetical protein